MVHWKFKKENRVLVRIPGLTGNQVLGRCQSVVAQLHTGLSHKLVENYEAVP